MTTTLKLKWRPYGKRVHQNAAQEALVHYRAWQLHTEMFPTTKRGGKRELGDKSPLTYTEYAVASTGHPAQYIRDLCRIGRCVPEDYLIAVMNTELDQFMFLLNLAAMAEEFKNAAQK